MIANNDLGSVGPDAEEGQVILLLEDEPDLNELYTLHIHALGYKVRSVFDGDAALELVQRDRSISLLLTDIMLGAGADGHEVARRARAVRPDLPVVYMSGYSSKVLAGDTGGEDNVALLAKPFRRNDLAECLRQLLSPPGSQFAPA